MSLSDKIQGSGHHDFCIEVKDVREAVKELRALYLKDSDLDLSDCLKIVFGEKLTNG